MAFMTLAGFLPTSELGGTDLVTAGPAPILEFLPIVTPV
jgi:hypothetical protein